MRNPITAYLNRRRAAKLAAEEARITAVLTEHPGSSCGYLMLATGMRMMRVVDALYRMRNAGTVTSTWHARDDDEWPGYQQWRLAAPMEVDRG